MNGHPEFLELIAMSIDFDLTDEEFGRLSTHLARCPECRRAAEELRGDATAIAAYPAPRLAPARAEQILRAALRTPRPQPRWGMLAVAAMLTTLGGGILFAGFQLINDDDPSPSEPPPSLVAEASAPPTSELAEASPDPGGDPPVDGPRMTPNPGDNAPPPDPGVLAFPLRSTRDIGPIRVAPATDDRLWVGFTRGNDTILALLDGSGAALEGWPSAVPNATDCLPLAAPDGSVRVLCYYTTETGECSDGGCGEDRIFAFRPDGSQLTGFPKSFPMMGPSAIDRYSARMVDDRLMVVEHQGLDGESESIGEHSLLEIRADGNLALGVRVQGPEICCTIGPDGAAYGMTPVGSEDAEASDILAFDQRGVRSGWPVTVEGSPSYPAFGPGGQLVFAVSVGDEGESRIIRYAADGSQSNEPVDPGATIMSDPERGDVLAPLAGSDGRMYATTEEQMIGLDSAGTSLDGWPFELEAPLLRYVPFDCPPGDTGCMTIEFHPPLISPQDLVYLVYPPDENEDQGGAITVVNRDGSVRSGWPKTLQRPGATWDSVTIGENRRAYAVALEPEPGDLTSGSISVFAPNGTRESFTVLFEP